MQEAYEPVVISSPVGRRVVANGAEVLNLASFNFIGASGDPKIKVGLAELCEELAAHEQWPCRDAMSRLSVRAFALRQCRTAAAHAKRRAVSHLRGQMIGEVVSTSMDSWQTCSSLQSWHSVAALNPLTLACIDACAGDVREDDQQVWGWVVRAAWLLRHHRRALAARGAPGAVHGHPGALAGFTQKYVGYCRYSAQPSCIRSCPGASTT